MYLLFVNQIIKKNLNLTSNIDNFILNLKIEENFDYQKLENINKYIEKTSLIYELSLSFILGVIEGDGSFFPY